VVFRNRKKRTDDALALFAEVNAKKTIFVPPHENHVRSSTRRR
jgi:hypothetical protein